MKQFFFKHIAKFVLLSFVLELYVCITNHILSLSIIYGICCILTIIYIFIEKPKQLKCDENDNEPYLNTEPIDWDTIKTWRELIWFGEMKQTERIKRLNDIYTVVKTDNGFTISKRK